jgi:hypothetical protein
MEEYERSFQAWHLSRNSKFQGLYIINCQLNVANDASLFAG